MTNPPYSLQKFLLTLLSCIREKHSLALCSSYLWLKHFNPLVIAEEASKIFPSGLETQALFLKLKSRLDSFLLWAVKYCSAITPNSLRLSGFLSIKCTDSSLEQDLMNCYFTIKSTTPSKVLSTSDNFIHRIK